MTSDNVMAPHGSLLLAHLQGTTHKPPAASLEEDFSCQPQSREGTKTEEAEETIEDARVEIVVINPRCAAQMLHVGITIMYYCTKCGHSSDQLLKVTEHLETGCDSGTGEAAQRLSQQIQDSEHGDHNYVERTHEGGSSTKGSHEGSLSSSEETLSADPRKWYCKWCPYTPLYSQMDLDQHRKCHGESGRDILTCYACPRDVGPSSSDWCRVRSHLFHFHKVDFQLQCEHCNAVLRGHTDYNKHVSSHKHSCGWHFCKYSSFNPNDVSAHEKCHSGVDGRQFRCYICKYQNKQLPGKWGIMHAHLVSRHSGVIDARFSCSECGKGFQELRRYQQHQPCKHVGVSQDYVRRRSARSERQDVMPGKDDTNGGMPGHVLTARKSLRLAQKIKRESAHKVLEGSSLHVDTDNKTENKPKAQLAEHTQGTTKSDSLTVMAGPIDDDILVAKDTSTTAINIKQCGNLATAAESETETAEDGIKAEAKTTPFIDKKQRCHHCYKKFATEARLQRHMLRQHTQEKMQKVPCPVCSKDFRNQMQMRNHKREVHEGKKRSRTSRPKDQKWYMCDRCTYTTPEASRLRNHKLSSHQGILPYKCPHCQFRTNEKSDLYRHRWKHRPAKRYQCSQCSYTTNTRWVLVNHCSKRHGIELPRLHRNTLGSTHGSKHLTKQLEKQWSVNSQLLSVIGDAQLQGLSVQDLAVHMDVQSVQTDEQGSMQDAVAGVQPDAHSVLTGEESAAGGHMNSEVGGQRDLPANIRTMVQQSESSQETVLSDNVRVVYVEAEQVEQSPLALITVLSEDSTQ